MATEGIVMQFIKSTDLSVFYPKDLCNGCIYEGSPCKCKRCLKVEGSVVKHYIYRVTEGARV